MMTDDLLKERYAKKLASQISNGEWLMSLPGADKQKAFLTMCVGCHTLQRVLTATHSADADKKQRAQYQANSPEVQTFYRVNRYPPK